jgi:ubiquinone/menaquinone biosynthesis C-methylase UbiE
LGRVTGWLEFWNGAHRIYVSDRHRDVHYRRIAQDIVALVPHGRAVVLDYGPGEALHAERIAAACGTLILCEAADATRVRLRERFGNRSGILVLAPAELSDERDHGIDLIIVNSVIQYLSPTELQRLLAEMRRLLAPQGRLVVADVIPPDSGMISDATALLSFASREGFLTSAVTGLAATFVSPYRKIRNTLGLARYGEAEMLAMLERAGFVAGRHRPNLGHNQSRMAFVATVARRLSEDQRR